MSINKIKFEKNIEEAKELFKIAKQKDVNKDEFLLAALLYIKNE